MAQISEVTVDLPPAPPVDADDSYAVDQTVTSESSEASDTRTLTLVALVDDVQVTTSWQQQGTSDTTPDTQALDTLFTDAVLKVRGADSALARPSPVARSSPGGDHGCPACARLGRRDWPQSGHDDIATPISNSTGPAR